ITFLFRTLLNAEKRYWATEIEVLRFVWAILKAKYWINITKVRIYCFIDYSAILNIIR
ncbi:hypothetical protein B0H65DRAFT_428255, partial [Neurospora tetraspora]